jgi:hypothetical protein
MAVNQTSRIGPKITPIPEAPLNWIANRPVNRMAVIGMMREENAGAAASSPSRADNTLIAGVIMPSPNSRPAPSISDHSSTFMPWFLYLCSRPYSANKPPSPSFSARNTSNAYSMATMRMIVQTASEIAPRTLPGVGGTPAGPRKICSIA